MARLLRVRDRILLGLALMADLLDEVRLVGGLVPKAYRQMYGFTPEKYQKENLYATVDRMLKGEFIEKVIVDGEPRFRLTSYGQKRFIREFPLLTLQNKRWDGNWRILVFDIPEEIRWRRDKLREKLKELGFGMVQKSVFISPHPFEDNVKDFLKTYGLKNYAFLFVSNTPLTREIEGLVESAWNINELNSFYEEFVVKFRQRVLGQERTQFVSEFTNLIMKDPFLPRELLPKPWFGDEARRLAKSIFATYDRNTGK